MTANQHLKIVVFVDFYVRVAPSLYSWYSLGLSFRNCYRYVSSACYELPEPFSSWQISHALIIIKTATSFKYVAPSRLHIQLQLGHQLQILRRKLTNSREVLDGTSRSTSFLFGIPAIWPWPAWTCWEFAPINSSLYTAQQLGMPCNTFLVEEKEIDEYRQRRFYFWFCCTNGNRTARDVTWLAAEENCSSFVYGSTCFQQRHWLPINPLFNIPLRAAFMTLWRLEPTVKHALALPEYWWQETLAQRLIGVASALQDVEAKMLSNNVL